MTTSRKRSPPIRRKRASRARSLGRAAAELPPLPIRRLWRAGVGDRREIAQMRAQYGARRRTPIGPLALERRLRRIGQGRVPRLAQPPIDHPLIHDLPPLDPSPTPGPAAAVPPSDEKR